MNTITFEEAPKSRRGTKCFKTGHLYREVGHIPVYLCIGGGKLMQTETGYSWIPDAYYEEAFGTLTITTPPRGE